MILVTITFTCSWLLPPCLSPDYHYGFNHHGYHNGTIISIVINENLPSHWPFIRAIAFSASTWIFHFFLFFSFSFCLIFLGAGVRFFTERGKNCSLVCSLFISHLLHEGDKSIALGFQGLGVSHYAAVPEKNHFKILCFGRSQEFLWLKIGTYEISPNGRKASRRLCVSISGLRSPTNMW